MRQRSDWARIQADASHIDVLVHSHTQSIRDLEQHLEHDLAEQVINKSIAAILQSLYTGIEVILSDILTTMDGSIPQGDSWHRRLLEQARNSDAMRPALISDATYTLLDDMMRFRHFVRNSYGIPIQTNRLLPVAASAHAINEKIQQDLETCACAVFGPGDVHEPNEKPPETPSDVSAADMSTPPPQRHRP